MKHRSSSTKPKSTPLAETTDNVVKKKPKPAPLDENKIATTDHAVKKKPTTSTSTPEKKARVHSSNTHPREVVSSSSTKKPSTSGHTHAHTSTTKTSSHRPRTHLEEGSKHESTSSHRPGRRHHAHHHHNPDGSLTRHGARATSSSIAKPLAPAKAFSPALDADGNPKPNLRPATMTAHIKRAVRKSEAMNPSKPTKVEPETALPKVHVPTPQTARQKATAAADVEATKRAQKVAAAAQEEQAQWDQQQQEAQKPKKKEKKYAPEAMIPTSRFVGNVGKTTGAALDTTGQVAKGVTDTVGRTAEGALGGGGVGKTVGAAAGGVGDTLGAATGGLGKTVEGATDGLAKGGPLGAVGGLGQGLGQTVGGVGKGLVSLSSPFDSVMLLFLSFCLVVLASLDSLSFRSSFIFTFTPLPPSFPFFVCSFMFRFFNAPSDHVCG